MSTPNFYSKAGAVYALDFSDDAGEYDADLADIAIEDVTTAVIEDLKAAGLSVTTADESDNERSYPGRVFAEVESDNIRDGVHCEAGLIIRSGYYADANLDFEIKVFDQFSGEYTDLEDLEDGTIAEACAVEKNLTVAQYNKYQKAGRVSYYSESDHFNTITTDVTPTNKQVAKIRKQIEKQHADLENTIREVYAKYTTPYRRVAMFSNGEAVYEKIGGKN